MRTIRLILLSFPRNIHPSHNLEYFDPVLRQVLRIREMVHDVVLHFKARNLAFILKVFYGLSHTYVFKRVCQLKDTFVEI